jgi:hypothetical protein
MLIIITCRCLFKSLLSVILSPLKNGDRDLIGNQTGSYIVWQANSILAAHVCKCLQGTRDWWKTGQQPFFGWVVFERNTEELLYQNLCLEDVRISLVYIWLNISFIIIYILYILYYISIFLSWRSSSAPPDHLALHFIAVWAWKLLNEDLLQKYIP